MRAVGRDLGLLQVHIEGHCKAGLKPPELQYSRQTVTRRRGFESPVFVHHLYGSLQQRAHGDRVEDVIKQYRMEVTGDSFLYNMY